MIARSNSYSPKNLFSGDRFNFRPDACAGFDVVSSLIGFSNAPTQIVSISRSRRRTGRNGAGDDDRAAAAATRRPRRRRPAPPPAARPGASRCVCRAWRDLVDARGLLRAYLLPRSVGGLFLYYYAHCFPEFLSRPTAGRSVSGDLSFVAAGGIWCVKDHCNGVLLCDVYRGYYCVANPATRRWARLPPRPPAASAPMGEAFVHQMKCLVYEPAESPHYHVFLIPLLRDDPKSALDPEMLRSEWPPASYPLQVFSSATGRWEERPFLRKGPAAGTIADMKHADFSEQLANHVVYWRKAVYVLCQNGGFFMRMSISNGEYRLVPMPEDIESMDHAEDIESMDDHSEDIESIHPPGCPYLGISQKGVYFAFHQHRNRLWIFLLTESRGQMAWEIKHRADLTNFSLRLNAREKQVQQHKGPWIIQDINYYKETYGYGDDKQKEVVEDNNFEWSSDDDDVLDTKDMVEGSYEGYTTFLGFHPFKEIVFLNVSLSRAVAYHWNTFKFQDLGDILPTGYWETALACGGIGTSFVYTPCWMEDFPENNSLPPTED